MIRIEGLPKLYSQMKKLRGQLEPGKVEPVMKEGADTLTEAVKDKAPILTGRLRENIVTLKMKPLGSNPASYMTKVKQGRREAPHAHLVEMGHKNAPPHPFFRPAWDSTKNPIFSRIVSRLKSLVEAL